MKLRGALWWIDRWRSSSAYMDLSAEAQGLYRNLCDEVWLRPEGVIPEASLPRASGFPELWKKHRVAILAHLSEREGGWTSETALEVMKQSEELRERQKAKGQKRAAGASRGLGGTFQPGDQPDLQPDASQEDQPKTTLPSPSPSPSPLPSQDQQPTDNGLSAPPAPSPPCPRCGRSDTPYWDGEDGTWMCAIDAGGAGGCGQRFKPSAPKPPDGARTKRRRNEELATREPKQKGGWVGRAMDLWNEVTGGVIAAGRAGRAFKPLVVQARKRKPALASDEEAWALIAPFLRTYLETTEPQYQSPEGFARSPRQGVEGGVSAKAKAREDGMRAEIEGGLRDE